MATQSKGASADDTLRTRRDVSVDASMVAPRRIDGYFDWGTIPLVQGVLERISERRIWVTPTIELTLVNTSSLVTIDLIGRGVVKFVPGSFSSGTITFVTYF